MPASMSIQVLVQHTFPLFGYRKLLGLGVCYGVTMLANDAILRGRPGIHEFVRRFQLLAQYNADNTALMRAIESTRGKRELGEQLSLDERLLLEMPAFIEKIHFLQDEENRLVKQESRRRLSSDTDMQHAEGTTELAAIAGIYAPGELEQSFTQLRAYDHLQPHSLLHAINLNFYNMEHIVAVAYDAALGKYLLFNADDPVSEFTALTAYDAASCAKKIHLA